MTAQQRPLAYMMPVSEWSVPALIDLPQDWNVAERVAIDIEARDEHLRALGIGVRRGGYVVGVSIAFEDGPKYYLPIRHAGGGNLDEKQVLDYLRCQAKNYHGFLAGANLSYDLDYLAEEGIEFSNVKRFRDVLVVEPLLDELQHAYTLDAVAKRRIGVGKDESALEIAAKAYGAKTKSDVKGIIWALPASMVGPYAEQDSWLPLKILRAQERVIETEDLWDVYDLESRVLPALLRMRRRGVRIDQDQLAQVGVWAREQEAQALVQVKALTGIEIAVGDSMKPELVAKALREIGVNPSFNAKGTPSVTAPFLDAISHPVGAQIRRARQMDKLRNTYVNGIKHHLTNGRIHCTFNQLMREGDDDRGIDGTIGGRVSAVNPNLQNQPIRHEEIGVRWRSIYIPEEGKQWAVNDFSQQEPRLLVHWSVLAGPRRIGPVAHSAALEAARRYTDDPSTDFHEMMAEMSGLAAKYGPKKGRKYAKSLGLGKIYGMGGVKLCRSLDLPTQFKSVKRSGRFVEAEVAGDEGQAIMDRFDAKVPFASAMLRADSNQAEKVGFIRTLSKRRCRCRKNDDGSYDWLYKMLNRRIQGSAADQTKEAVCALDAAGYYIQIQVHDEIDGSVADAAEARRMAEIMEQCMPLMVPSKVDVEIGPNWGEVKGV